MSACAAVHGCNWHPTWHLLIDTQCCINHFWSALSTFPNVLENVTQKSSTVYSDADKLQFNNHEQSQSLIQCLSYRDSRLLVYGVSALIAEVAESGVPRFPLSWMARVLLLAGSDAKRALNTQWHANSALLIETEFHLEKILEIRWIAFC